MSFEPTGSRRTHHHVDEARGRGIGQCHLVHLRKWCGPTISSIHHPQCIHPLLMMYLFSFIHIRGISSILSSRLWIQWRNTQRWGAIIPILLTFYSDAHPTFSSTVHPRRSSSRIQCLQRRPPRTFLSPPGALSQKGGGEIHRCSPSLWPPMSAPM